MNDYVGLNIKKREINIVDIPVEMIRSGDSFYIRRDDGLDPMIAFAMGVNHGIFYYYYYILKFIIRSHRNCC